MINFFVCRVDSPLPTPTRAAPRSPQSKCHQTSETFPQNRPHAGLGAPFPAVDRNRRPHGEKLFSPNLSALRRPNRKQTETVGISEAPRHFVSGAAGGTRGGTAAGPRTSPGRGGGPNRTRCPLRPDTSRVGTSPSGAALARAPAPVVLRDGV